MLARYARITTSLFTASFQLTLNRISIKIDFSAFHSESLCQLYLSFSTLSRLRSSEDGLCKVNASNQLLNLRPNLYSPRDMPVVLCSEFRSGTKIHAATYLNGFR